MRETGKVRGGAGWKLFCINSKLSQRRDRTSCWFSLSLSFFVLLFFIALPLFSRTALGNTRKEREMLRTESLFTNYIYCNILEIVYFLFLIILRENFNDNFSLFLSFLLSFTVVYRDASLIDPSLIKQGDSLRCRIRGKDIANRS